MGSPRHSVSGMVTQLRHHLTALKLKKARTTFTGLVDKSSADLEGSQLLETTLAPVHDKANNPQNNEAWATQSTKALVREREVTFAHVETVTGLSKLHHIPVRDVSALWKEFSAHDPDGTGLLLQDSFTTAIRLRLGLAEDAGVPPSALDRTFLDANQNPKPAIDFEAFLLWAISAYPEELLSPKERENRHVSRACGVDICLVERIRGVFERYDSSQDGTIDEEEFRNVVTDILGIKDPSEFPAKRLQLFWREVDTDASGEVSFEEFVVWYINVLSADRTSMALYA
eukprot:NODE_2343_length_953_cov_6.975501.p1 GENE.NODE_2343_length_953_cov_6.975501~~NODE_2343_length_953_cov_6.975501.p1  ORF type:complete len:286 (-),score=82.49 NODE_2343_length_953_cov_6.975501:79-936(-)